MRADVCLDHDQERSLNWQAMACAGKMKSGSCGICLTSVIFAMVKGERDAAGLVCAGAASGAQPLNVPTCLSPSRSINQFYKRGASQVTKLFDSLHCMLTTWTCHDLM